MKIEQLLVQHFYNIREVTLQGIGKFVLSPDFVMPKESDKDLNIPANAISFEYDKKAEQDDALIRYIVEKTGKMKPLAAADLDSYLVLGKQFLNIGKAFKIEGMGSILKSQQGVYEFSQGSNFHSKLQTGPAAAAKESVENAEISFASAKKARPNNRKVLLAVMLVIVAGMAGTSFWFFLFKNKKMAEPATVQQLNQKDTVSIAQRNVDSTATVKTETTKIDPGYNFKVVFMTTRDSAVAARRMNVLVRRGHTVLMYKHDSVSYRLAEPFERPLADTTYVKDSLNRYYFLGSAFIELNK